MTPEKEQEYRDEAERLARLPEEDWQAIVALHRSVAANPKVPRRERRNARERAEALERHLRPLARRRKT
jgi:hypothetical protein